MKFGKLIFTEEFLLWTENHFTPKLEGCAIIYSCVLVYWSCSRLFGFSWLRWASRIHVPLLVVHPCISLEEADNTLVLTVHFLHNVWDICKAGWVNQSFCLQCGCSEFLLTIDYYRKNPTDFIAEMSWQQNISGDETIAAKCHKSQNFDCVSSLLQCIALTDTEPTIVPFRTSSQWFSTIP